MRLVDQIAQRVQALIQEQGLQAGDRLPAERRLAEQLGVSRPSLREAIQQLSSQGLLTSRRGGGTYLSAPPSAAGADAGWTHDSLVGPLGTLFLQDPHYRYDVLEARGAIEGATAWLAAQRATDADRERLRQACEATLRHGPQDPPEAAARADARFHLAIAEASHNLVLLQTMRGLFELLQATVTQSRQRLYSAEPTATRLDAQHHEILQAILDGDAEQARQAMLDHLDYVGATVRALDDDQARLERSARLPHSP